jgi:hypothetical protein
LNADGTEAYITLLSGWLEILTSEQIVDGFASVSFDSLEFPSSDLNIKVETLTPGELTDYLLEVNGEPVNVIPTGMTDITQSHLFNLPDIVHLNGNYCYSIGKNGMWVCDVSDINNPLVVGEALFDFEITNNLSAGFSGTYGYVWK